MRKKNLPWIMLIPLLLSLTTMFPMVAPGLAQVGNHPAEAMWVDLNVTEPLPNCTTFTVNVYINVSTAGMNPGATGLYAWEFMLFWENNKLNCTGATDHLPFANWNPPNSMAFGTGINQTYNATHGRVWRAISAIPAVLPNPTPFVGVMSICTLTFHVTYQGELDLALLILAKPPDTMMGDDTAEGFALTVYDNSLEVIPEFPVALIMPLFMLTTLVAVILGKTARSRKRRSHFVAK